MQAKLELTAQERQALTYLTADEREALLDDLIEKAREELEWSLLLATRDSAAPRTGW